MSVAVHHGDCREIIPTLGVPVDAVVTDPPYHLQDLAGRAGRPFHAKDGLQKNGAMARLAAGFMGQQWDGGDIAFRPETWATIGSVMRPGAFLVAFGGTRTYHRLACAIEDSGFVIQDCLMWLFATGFPKRRDMLKPAYEPIVLAYKPGGKRTMQVDECRIATEAPRPSRIKLGGKSNGIYGDGLNNSRARGVPDTEAGRWPANICHDGSDEVVALFPESAGQQAYVGPEQGDKPSINVYGDFGARHPSPPRGDGGSAARFFFSAKAGSEDRWGSRHPTVKPVDLISWLVTLVTPPGGTFLDPFAGSGTAAVAALKTGRSAILIEREEGYYRDIMERIAFYEGGGQHSVQAKHRNRKVDHGPLFERPYDPELDALESYNTAVQAIGERVKAGAPVPEFMLSRKPK